MKIILAMVLLLSGCSTQIYDCMEIISIEKSYTKGIKYVIELKNPSFVLLDNFFFLFTNKEYKVGQRLGISKSCEGNKIK